MLINTRAIIIHTYPYSESSLIVKAYTEKLGFSSFLIKGFKRNKKQKINLHPMASVEITCVSSGQNSLKLVRNISLLNPYSRLLSNPIKSGLAMFLAEFLGHTLRDAEEGDAVFFQWLTGAIDYLEETDSLANFHLWFLLNLSDHLGFAPQGRMSIETPYFSISEGSFLKNSNSNNCLNSFETELFDRILNKKLDECALISFSRNERASILAILHSYFQIHIERDFTLKSLDILNHLYTD